MTKVLLKLLFKFLILTPILDDPRDYRKCCFNLSLMSQDDLSASSYYLDTPIKCFFLFSSFDIIDGSGNLEKEEVEVFMEFK